MARILIGCEYSGRVREAFRAKGHYAMSCDLLPTEVAGNHYQGDIRDILGDNWDLGIFFPPCINLAVSGARWFKDKVVEQAEALDFVRLLMDAPIPRIAIENPVSVISSKIRKPDQTFHPYHFGHMEQKRTCLWLKNLPLLVPTNNVYDEMMQLPKAIRERVHNLPPSPDRWKERSRTFSGVSEAMASQWSPLLP